MAEERAPQPDPDPVGFPVAESAPAGTPTGVSLWEVPPPSAGAEHPQDPFHHFAMPDARPTAGRRPRIAWEVRRNLRPLRVGEPDAASGHLHLRPA
jgi:hypothetical protein